MFKNKSQLENYYKTLGNLPISNAKNIYASYKKYFDRLPDKNISFIYSDSTNYDQVFSLECLGQTECLLSIDHIIKNITESVIPVKHHILSNVIDWIWYTDEEKSPNVFPALP